MKGLSRRQVLQAIGAGGAVLLGGLVLPGMAGGERRVCREVLFQGESPWSDGSGFGRIGVFVSDYAGGELADLIADETERLSGHERRWNRIAVRLANDWREEFAHEDAYLLLAIGKAAMDEARLRLSRLDVGERPFLVAIAPGPISLDGYPCNLRPDECLIRIPGEDFRESALMLACDYLRAYALPGLIGVDHADFRHVSGGSQGLLLRTQAEAGEHGRAMDRLLAAHATEIACARRSMGLYSFRNGMPHSLDDLSQLFEAQQAASHPDSMIFFTADDHRETGPGFTASLLLFGPSAYPREPEVACDFEEEDDSDSEFLIPDFVRQS